MSPLAVTRRVYTAQSIAIALHALLCIDDDLWWFDDQVLCIPRQAFHEVFVRRADLCRRTAAIEAAYLPSNDDVIATVRRELDW